MNKNELAKEIASQMSVTITESLKFIDTLCVVVGESLLSCYKISDILHRGNKKNVLDGIHVPE